MKEESFVKFAQFIATRSRLLHWLACQSHYKFEFRCVIQRLKQHVFNSNIFRTVPFLEVLKVLFYFLIQVLAGLKIGSSL